MERRLRQMRSRVLVRSWAYRQRRHAHGVWFDVRRLLAQASAAYVVSAEDMQRLVEEGHRQESAAAALQPPKMVVFARGDRVARLPSAWPVPVRMSAEVLAAEHLVLVPF